MLSPEARDKMQAGMEAVVEALGVPATWTQTKAPNAVKDVVLGFKTAGWRDEELLNAYGIGAKVFTVNVSDIPVIQKFDRITVSGETYTIDSVMPVHLNGVHIFHKCYVRGK